MSLALSLLPFEDVYGSRSSYSVLSCNLGGRLYDVIHPLPEQAPVPEMFMSHMSREGGDDTHFGITKRDGDGELVQCLPALVLLRVKDNEFVQSNAKNRAVWAYLAQLPPETPVALYWH